MHRYFCSDLQGDRSGNRESAEFVFRVTPPLFEFTFFEYSTRRTWFLRNTHWNLQARQSLESLQPPRAWVMNVGVRRVGEFRAIRPATPTPMLPLTVTFRCEISWGSAFVNLTTCVDGSYMLFSMRPPESRPDWLRLDNRPPTVDFVTPEEVVVPSSRPATHSAENQAPAAGVTRTQCHRCRGHHSDEPSSSSITVVNETGAHGSGDDSRNQPAAGPADAREPPMIGGDSQDYPAVEIVDEITGQDMFARVFVGSIPFSVPPITHDQEVTAPTSRITHRPITLAEIDPHGVYGFDEGMAIFRAENERRLDVNHGTRLPPGNAIAVPHRPALSRPILVRPLRLSKSRCPSRPKNRS